MTITRVFAGSSVTGTTSLSPAYPTSPVAGDLIMLSVAFKYGGTATVNTPAGFTAPANNTAQGGAGSGADAGIGACAVFYKVSDGTETGTISVSVTSGNVAIASVRSYRSDKPRNVWSIACVSASDASAGTGWSAAAGSDPGVQAGDMCVVTSGANTDAYGYASQSLTQSGITFGAAVELSDTGTGLGDDASLVVTEHPVTAGTSGGNPTYAMTASGSTASAPVGGTVIMRIRDTTGSALDVTVFNEELQVAVVGGNPSARLTAVEAQAIIIGGNPAARLTNVEVYVARSPNQEIDGGTGLDFAAAMGDPSGASVESLVIPIGDGSDDSLDFGMALGTGGAVYQEIDGTGVVGLDFGMDVNRLGTVQNATIGNTTTINRLDPEAAIRGRYDVEGLYRKVNRPPLPKTLYINDDDSVSELRSPSMDLDPDRLFLGGSIYELRSDDPRYEALVDAGYDFEVVG